MSKNQQVTFTIREVNLNRKMRGTESIRVDVVGDCGAIEWLWMKPKDIELNKRDFGSDCFTNSLKDFLL